MRTLTENDYKVMSRILDEKNNIGLSKLSGVTRKSLVELTGLSYSKIRLALEALIEYEFVEEGIAKGKERTYFLTEKGMMELKLLVETSINIKEDNVNE